MNTFVSGQLRKKFDLSRGSPLDSLVRTTLLLWMPSSRDHLDKYKNYCMELFVNYISNLYSSLVLDPRIDLVNCADRLSLIKTTSKSMASFIQCLLEDLLGYHDKRPFPLLCHYADLFLRQIGIFTKFYFAFPTVESFSEIDIFQFLGISTSNPETFFQKTENYFKNIMKLPKIPPMSDFLYPFPYHIVQLPNRFDELVMKTLRIACANCKKVPNETAICLFCGKLCCAQSYCCLSTTSEITVPLLGSTLSIGECNQHVLDGCCNSFGGFLFIQRAAILLLTIRGKGCFRPAPYIDSHGEADFGLRRGSPLFLDEALLKHYEYLWLTHSVPSAIESANQEDNSNNGNYNPRLWLSM